MTGRIHSFESFGTLDGPGIRFVIFFQGCPLRCLYCHNPDTWNVRGGRPVTTSEILTAVQSSRPFIEASKGGITASGGEPLLQAPFVAELFRAAHEQGIHTALDTSGYSSGRGVAEALEESDLVLLDIKSFDKARFRAITGGALSVELAFLDRLAALNKPTWIRYVLVPGLTDDLHEIARLGEHLSEFSNVERIEVLPFHKLGEYKWKKLGYPYALTDTSAPDPETVTRAQDLLSVTPAALRRN